jgi:hypothetical protein
MKHYSLPPLEVRMSPNQSKRQYPDLGVKMIAVHDPEGFWDGTISTIMNPKTEVSYHAFLKADGSKAIQFVPWNRKSWSCRIYNSVTENLCLEGFYNKPYDDEALHIFARMVAFRLHKRGLPATAVLPGMVGTTQGKGFTQHKFLGALGGNHKDFVNTDAKWKAFAAMVKSEAAYGHFRKTWGRSN